MSGVDEDERREGAPYVDEPSESTFSVLEFCEDVVLRRWTSSGTRNASVIERVQSCN